ncbi:TetR/AcrR family transcriptional regulator [Rhabdothermincola salaria]|uniref:TetR/AcrR family transcriptional regulator n=1 Tax=Rhabdothermincola salaria TaxID=2903142 RepID=UPI001E6419B2|nr:TetR/AcrR family transcriptional regulator [Rhabdothermincola salaria]MCD9622447.1 TetR/AcrR family transcriptional regulator [Rhabdothermincola salaria]
MARRLTPRGLERRRQLMRYATERFAAQGYHTTSVAEIVDGIGVGKGVFYWYFESKDALLTAILQEAQRDLRRAQQDAIEGVQDPVRRIELGIRASVRWYAANRAVDQVSSFARSEARFADVLRQGTEVAVSDTMRHLREAVAREAVRDGDLELQANAILGVTRHLARRFLREADRPIDAVADEAVAFCLGGLNGPLARVVGTPEADRGTVA